MAQCAGLQHELGQRVVAAAVSAAEHQILRCRAPALLFAGKALLDLLPQQPAPGFQVDFQQQGVVGGDQPLALGFKQGAGRVAGAPQGRGEGGVDRQILECRSGGARLPEAFFGQAGQVVATLNPLLGVEAAEPVANQHKP